MKENEPDVIPVNNYAKAGSFWGLNLARVGFDEIAGRNIPGGIRIARITSYNVCYTKLLRAEASDLYDIKMESAAIIRKAAHTLLLQYHHLKLFGFEEVEYYEMVRDLIEEYRLLFIDWVGSFDQTNYVVDRWGLFNPPGVGPNDKNPDDDLPFNIDDFEFDG